MSTPGKVKVNVTTQNGEKLSFDCTVQQTLMNAIRDEAELEMIGACNGCLDCATCHACLSDEWIKKVPPPSTKEQDLLDQLDSEANSRLCCQIKLTEELNGIEVILKE